MSGTDTKYRTPGKRLNKPSFHETCFPPIRILPANHANGRESENFSLRFIRAHSRNSRASLFSRLNGQSVFCREIRTVREFRQSLFKSKPGRHDIRPI